MGEQALWAKLPVRADELALDGMEVRKLVRQAASSMAHFRLEADRTSRAVAHEHIEELWDGLGGEGELWMSLPDGEVVVTLESGVSVAIPPMTPFQTRANQTLDIVGVATPAWPGDHEARLVAGKWVGSEL